MQTQKPPRSTSGNVRPALLSQSAGSQGRADSLQGVKPSLCQELLPSTQESPRDSWEGCACLQWVAGAGEGCDRCWQDARGGLAMAVTGLSQGLGKHLSRRNLHGRPGDEEERSERRGFTKAFTVVCVSLHGQEACQCHDQSWRVSLPASVCAGMSHHM